MYFHTKSWWKKNDTFNIYLEVLSQEFFPKKSITWTKIWNRITNATNTINVSSGGIKIINKKKWNGMLKVIVNMTV